MKRSVLGISLVLCLFQGANAGPLEDFKDIVSKCRQSIVDLPNPTVKYQDNKSDWMKVVNGPAKVSFDVRKTDSLVSPFVGTIEIVMSVAAGRASTEQAANALDLAPGRTGARLEIKVINFAYREDGSIWEATGSRTKHLQLVSDDGKTGNEFEFSSNRDSILKYMEPTKACNNLR